MSILKLLALLSLLAAVSCAEKPQTLYQSNARAEQRSQSARLDLQRQRTIGQDEGNRVNNEGMLR
jgi:hypothetical protein